MYINTKKHYLSKSIYISAGIGLLAQIVNAVSRIFFDAKVAEPDMLNQVIFIVSMVLQVVVILVIIFVFSYYIRQMRHIVRLMKDDDSDEMAILQRKYIPDDISSLKAEAIYQLLEIWASIFIFVQIMSLVSNYEYRSLIRRLSELIPLDSYENAVTFYDIYNSTHGFKYIGMFAALIIGIFVTAVFLKDRFLKIVTVSVTGVFMLAFTIFQMITFETNFKIISIVWTSIIYHGLETIGLILFAIYLSKNYKGL
ncbi:MULTISPECIES: hypothetical protein [Pseudobutyrivibrio]|uniref:Uncharacterized protein n=1 Tax=Pseudobutyrivibrio ruminis TaxID=46206 RepID=A0A2G3DUT7_9FIRM|nr:hypothetical protein [Pseudobutyrivibrio ruminis]PHU34817.1 hypothetical protein CSX01_05605 [Pseudobutyrivibrio ruminis]